MAQARTITTTASAAVMVEDDPDIALLVQEVVDGDVQHFVDGESAVEALTKADTLPAFVLLDLELPGMDGLEVLRRLRAHPQTRRVPVVIFTGTDTDPDMGYRLGANAWVKKPHDADALIEAVRHIQAFWRHLNQPSH